ncbi:MAG: hypothetical protein V4721_10615 [Bacteroidota bacterium]
MATYTDEQLEKTMTPQPKNKVIKVLIFIWEKVPKTVFWGLISTIIVGSVTFSYAFVEATKKTNENLPIEINKTKELNQKVDRLVIDVEVMKTNGANTSARVIEIYEEQIKQRDLFMEMYATMKQINNNTK